MSPYISETANITETAQYCHFWFEKLSAIFAPCKIFFWGLNLSLKCSKTRFYGLQLEHLQKQEQQKMLSALPSLNNSIWATQPANPNRPSSRSSSAGSVTSASGTSDRDSSSSQGNFLYNIYKKMHRTVQSAELSTAKIVNRITVSPQLLVFVLPQCRK